MNIKKIFLGLILLGFFTFILVECSKVKKDLPIEPQGEDAQLHQIGWLDTLSTGFHGKYIRDHKWDMATCRKCHGNDYAGGTSQSSCNIQGCHSGTPEACTTCHGGFDNTTAAPPKDIERHVLTSYIGVGAHTAHVTKLTFGRAFDCSECHIKPAKLDASGHLDNTLSAEIVWGAFSKSSGLTPSYADSSCANVYCHGASLSGGSLTTPVWNQSESLNCSSCHSQPPTSGAHETHAITLQQDCNICHNGYIKNTTINAEIHIDGKLDVELNTLVGGAYANGICSNVSCHGSGDSPLWTSQSGVNCTSCHGGTDNTTGAPPVDLEGHTGKTFTGVGVHTAHVSSPRWVDAFDCNECHIKPIEVTDPGHIDNNRPAEIVWGQLSKTDNLNPDWDGATCSDVYCHGASLADGKNSNPSWTSTADISCDDCHGLPPKTGAHEEHIEEYSIDCNICHDGYLKNTTVDIQTHLDGYKDVKLNSAVGGSYSNGVCSNVLCHGSGTSPNWNNPTSLNCVSCHGGTDNSTGAPPVDLKGNSSRAQKGVGAHTAHLSNSNLAKAYDCNQCHIKPVNISDAGHIDLTPPVEITWGGISKNDNLTPSWNGTTCSDVYCHGASLSDGQQITPTWTSTQALACNSCHGSLPKSGAHEEHAENYQFGCDVCHDGYAKDTSVNSQMHVNGVIDVQFKAAIGGSYSNGTCSEVLCHGANNSISWTGGGSFTCQSCHGGLDNITGAPPYDLNGNSVTTVKGVGAHSVHVSGSALSDGMDCTECHVKPHEVDDAGHIDANLLPAEITWGNLAKHEEANPQWDGVQTCSNVYCHGKFENGNQSNSPSWIIVDGTQAACGTCHSMPPGGDHPTLTQCNLCHASVVDQNNTIISKDKHVNGEVNYN